ncbi:hypothetical protein HID58_070287 [Brassica napus]|uniref:Uncharacterized protein n=1 Tax=Brassica napus TaxID=3708 RepID=A0ABQ7YYD3_BRANA|nr:hypothetical protein HID58_070287 [Brassica napus]
MWTVMELKGDVTRTMWIVRELNGNVFSATKTKRMLKVDVVSAMCSDLKASRCISSVEARIPLATIIESCHNLPPVMIIKSRCNLHLALPCCDSMGPGMSNAVKIANFAVILADLKASRCISSVEARIPLATIIESCHNLPPVMIIKSRCNLHLAHSFYNPYHLYKSGIELLYVIFKELYMLFSVRETSLWPGVRNQLMGEVDSRNKQRKDTPTPVPSLYTLRFINVISDSLPCCDSMGPGMSNAVKIANFAVILADLKASRCISSVEARIPLATIIESCHNLPPVMIIKSRCNLHLALPCCDSMGPGMSNAVKIANFAVILADLKASRCISSVEARIPLATIIESCHNLPPVMIIKSRCNLHLAHSFYNPYHLYKSGIELLYRNKQRKDTPTPVPSLYTLRFINVISDSLPCCDSMGPGMSNAVKIANFAVILADLKASRCISSVEARIPLATIIESCHNLPPVMIIKSRWALEYEMRDAHIAIQARLISQALIS